MADCCSGCDHDSAFGDDECLWAPGSMFPTQALAGKKRVADKPECSNDGYIDPCCTQTCPEACNVRPSKRRAVGEDHATTDSHPNIEADCQFPDDCFEKFCQECNLDPYCPPECALPCPGDHCPEDGACFDPQCDQKNQHCTDGCIDPECTKAACPEQPCLCQKCDTQPCPLGDPNNECHLAHSAPSPVGTVYCYDNAPCHFQEGLHEHDNTLASFEIYPCFSQTHGYTIADDVTTAASSAQTPALSHSNYTSLESAFTNEPSPASGQTQFPPDCLLDISGDHCHIDNSCCHGTNRACGEAPSATQQQQDLWNSSTASGDGLAGSFMNFGFHSMATRPMSADRNSMTSNPFSLDHSMLGFNDQAWMLTDSSFSNTFQTDLFGANKLDYLAAAVQNDILRPNTTTPVDSGSTHGARLSHSQACICKWKHAPGVLCLALFDTPSALHAHIKSAHVDACTHCLCQWEGCEASSKDFKQRSKLSRHLLGHAGHRPYACGYEGCDKTFATNQAKDNHERTHTGERPYVCDRCGYTTTTHTQLQTHISALHDGKKPHKCRFCDFTCADSSNLSKHERTHQTLRPYRCPHPNCTFKPDCRWENLKRHLRRSGHCSQLLVESSEEYKAYREGVRREIDDWHRRNEDGGVGGKPGKRKGRG
ncbi:hypothetical protein EJ02DRAFT_502274 [Clathrospora elynae]|uniref:C2H2 type master regulator of conidiophore development brlA n=1 Tax=Clathrospora elynae TaxID=706981 RepID=A0A6A5STS8_9PLEO|nr:hypothetical protein EJ02DRAFT_502274 [Clathrospora elynae]